ncbi:hypothetical protein TP2_17340 [Thioclava pacifica DSM 10166]|uniref:Glycosyl transferase family 1 domain-containing protein n=2 Tax=Thioclava pacifica TaxID=285109 RepID=A0A074JDV5_9RHOB|nr:hypothetical protein TP2_17340 [Thioclava pacifica DSM 10166]
MAEAELDEIDAVGVERSYWGGWAESSAGRALQFGADALRDPGVVALLARNKRWTRPEVFAARRMRRLQNAAPHGVLHIHYGRNAALLLDAGWTGRAVVTWHGYDANIVPRERGQDVYQDLFTRDWIHTVGSSFMKRRLVTLGAREDRIVKIPMGVDFTRFAQVDRRERPEGPLNVVAVGRLDEMKGYPVLIDAVAEALGQGVSLQLTILGEGPDRASIEARIEARGLQDRVRLLGAQRSDQVVRELAAADVFALTGVVAASGRVETQGVAYIEAQATGLPVIASDVGGVSESLDPGRSGILTAEGDVAAVAKALVAYAKDPGLRLEHGQRGAEFVRAAFSMSDMLDAFEALYAREAV